MIRFIEQLMRTFWNHLRGYSTTLTITWALVYLTLSYQRLNFYDGFYGPSYSAMGNFFLIGFLGFVFIVLSMKVTRYFWPWKSKFKFLLVCVFMLFIVYETPLLKPFDFFLLTQRANSPLASCAEACAVKETDNDQLGINGPPIWSFVVYTPNDALATCITDADRRSQECIAALKHTGVWTKLDLPDPPPEWDKDYPDWLKVWRLTSKNYYYIAYER